MRRAIDETERRREKQHQYNIDNNITPKGVVRKITDVMDVGTYSDAKSLDKVAEASTNYQINKDAEEPLLTTIEIDQKISELEKLMQSHAQNLEFEQAALVRDKIAKLRVQQLSS
jgi:excinuclease ABC subunit B